jgi:hypothetical protein
MPEAPFLIQEMARDPDEFRGKERFCHNSLIFTERWHLVEDVRAARHEDDREGRIPTTHQPGNGDPVVLPLSPHGDTIGSTILGDHFSMAHRRQRRPFRSNSVLGAHHETYCDLADLDQAIADAQRRRGTATQVVDSQNTKREGAAKGK